MIDYNKIKEDQVQVSGEFKKELPRAGSALLRFRSYLEKGRKEDGKGDSYPVARLEFELHHPDHIISGVSKDGTPYSFPQKLVINDIPLGKSKSRFGKLFAAMNYKKTARHMCQLVGGAYLATIVHNTSGKNTYANISDETGWTISAPEQLDFGTNTLTPVMVPPLSGKAQVFLLDHPDFLDAVSIKDMWDSIYIEGMSEATEKFPAKSKNWIQESIMASFNFKATETYRVISGIPGIDLGGVVAPPPPVDLLAPQGVAYAETQAPQQQQPVQQQAQQPPVQQQAPVQQQQAAEQQALAQQQFIPAQQQPVQQEHSAREPYIFDDDIPF